MSTHKPIINRSLHARFLASAKLKHAWLCPRLIENVHLPTAMTLAKGVPIETVSKMLGHTNIVTTQIYARITNDKIGRDMQALAGQLENIEKIALEE